MGYSTVFYDPELLFDATKEVKNVVSRITKKYLSEHKKAKSELAPDDWFVETDTSDLDKGDVLTLKPNHKAHRGSASDFIPNLLILIKVLRSYGLEPHPGTVPYSTDGLSGVLRLGETKITLVEVDSASGEVEQFTYPFEDVKKIYKGTFPGIAEVLVAAEDE